MYTRLVLRRNPTDPPAPSGRREPSPQGMQDFTHLRGRSRFWLVFGTLLCQVPADPNLHCQRRALYIGKTMNQAALEQGPTLQRSCSDSLGHCFPLAVAITGGLRTKARAAPRGSAGVSAQQGFALQVTAVRQNPCAYKES